ncbi:hypothetical protein [Marinobacter halodurans]|uniref:hypothetical protein n=1 Tax=Marinobacter halodurans TaxID=2528979 RepID=UPI0013F16BF2|nr:hypothetical protein [Marinobacter halodurans]
MIASIPEPMVRRFGSLQRIGTFGISRWQRQNFLQFERAVARSSGAKFGHVLDLKQRNFLNAHSELEADLNQCGVLFRIAVLLNYIQEMGELLGCEHHSACLRAIAGLEGEHEKQQRNM